MKKVTGIGGVFFKCKDPKAVNEWYKTHLGFETTPYGTSFEWRHTEDPTQKGTTVWNPFKEDINEKLIMELAKAAADAGMKEFDR